MSLNNGVFTRGIQGSTSDNFDDILYSPEMEDMLDDRLELARQNRTNYYRKMLASRSRPVEDYTVTKRVGYRRSGSPAKEPSISDTVPGPVAKIPEPHSSWRFYTSYDNGEWKRHAVPVHKEEEEILREPKKSLRRERDTGPSTQSPPVESSLRRMRQSGGPLLACLQPRPKKASDTQKTTTTVHTVNGQPLASGATEFGGQFGLPDWACVSGDGELVRRYSDGGTEYVLMDAEPVQGSVKQEFSSKYTSTVTVTQPNGSHLKPGVQAKGVVGGETVGQGETGESGVRKSRRPRIYGFQEKIIIPTKYKNMENTENGGENSKEGNATVGQSVAKTKDSKEVTTVNKVSLVEDGMTAKEGIRGVGGGVGWRGGPVGRGQTTEAVQSVPAISHLKVDSGARERAVPGQTVKVVVMNSSGSDTDSDKKPAELSSSEESKEVRDDAHAIKLNTGMPESLIQIPMMFQDGKFPIEEIKALHENLHANLLPAISPAKDRDTSVSTIEDKTSLVPNVFSKEEEAFSEVGPDGTKCDGKVSRTYEVYTTTNKEKSTIQDKPLSPVEVRVVPIQEEQRSTLKPSSVSCSRQDKTTNDKSETSGSHFSQQEIRVPPKTITPTVSPKTDDKKTTDIFEQTGSLFKTITPRPRSAREKESMFTAREGHLRKASDDGVPQRSDGVTSKTSRVVLADEHNGFRREMGASEKAPSRVGAGETVPMKVEHVWNEIRSSRQLHSTVPPAAGKALERDSFGAVAIAGSSESSDSNPSSALRSQGWNEKAQTKKSSFRTTENVNDKEWDVQVAVKD